MKQVCLFGKKESCLDIYRLLSESEEIFDVLCIVCEEKPIFEENQNVFCYEEIDDYCEYIQAADITYICVEEDSDMIKDILEEMLPSEKICEKEELYKSVSEEYVKMMKFSQRIRHEYQNKYKSKLVEVGEFSYGVPVVRSWDDKTKLKIGKFCSIADNVKIFLGGNHRCDWGTTYPFNSLMNDFDYITGHPASNGDVSIGNDVWLASGCTILSGVTIGDGAVVAAGAMITKDVPPYAIVAGNPAQVVKYRFTVEQRRELQKIKWWDWSYTDIYKAIPYLQNDIEKLLDYYEMMKEKNDIK